MKSCRTYVGGPYSCDPLPEALNNMRRGIRASADLLRAGLIPFCPFLDFLLWFVLDEGEIITKDEIYAYSMEWLEVCDVMYVLSGWERSTGTKKEIIRAKERGIPVFYTREDLMEWVRKEVGE